MSAPGEMDFAAARAEAEKALDSAENTSSASPDPITESNPPEPKSEVVAETVKTEPATKAETVASNAVSDDLFEVPDTAKIKVKIDGQEKIVTAGEYKDALRREATWTQRQQAFADTRKKLENEINQKLQELEAREKAIKEMASSTPKVDPVTQTILDALKAQYTPKAKDPGEIATLGELQSERENVMKQVQEMLEKERTSRASELEQAARAVREQAEIQRERQAYNAGLTNILNKPEYKVLSEIDPNFASAVMFKVKGLGPENLDQALEFSEEYVKERFETFKKITTAAEQSRLAAAAKAKMENTTGQPAVTGQAAPKVVLNKRGQLDWDAMAKKAHEQWNRME